MTVRELNKVLKLAKPIAIKTKTVEMSSKLLRCVPGCFLDDIEKEYLDAEIERIDEDHDVFTIWIRLR